MSATRESKPLILVVDDAVENIRAIHAILKDDYTILFAVNGPAALQIAHTQQPDLILLDAVMPDMDGYAVCTALKSAPRTRDVPVIFVSGLNETHDETRAFAVGAVDFITKPVNVATTRVRVRTHIAMKRQADALRDTERKLAESVDLLRVTLESIAEAVITTDDRGHVVWLNSVAATMTGWARDDARGQASMDVFTVVDAETGHVREHPVPRCLAEGRRVTLEGHAMLVARDGREYKIDTSVSPIRDGDGRHVGVVLVFRDVSEQNPRHSPPVACSR